jgi:hypothetical protein
VAAVSKRQVTYYPPDAKTIKEYARQVCQELGLKGNADYVRPDVINGLADYLNFSAELIAKLLNEGHDELLDTTGE